MSSLTDQLGNGIRTGEQYLDGLRDDRDVWIHGEKVKDVTAHPGLSRGAHTLAEFMDRQFDDKYRDVITYEENGKKFATSYMIPKSQDDIVKRGESFYEWAKWSNGMFGRNAGLQECLGDGICGGRRFSQGGQAGVRGQHAQLLRVHKDE